MFLLNIFMATKVWWFELIWHINIFYSCTHCLRLNCHHRWQGVFIKTERVTPSNRKRPQVVCLCVTDRAFSQSLSKCDTGSNRSWMLCFAKKISSVTDIACVCVCLRLLQLIAFVLLHLSGSESGSRLAAGDVCHSNILPTRPNGHSHPMSCLESAREQFLNQTECCCTGYPWWLNLDSCRPTAYRSFSFIQKKRSGLSAKPRCICWKLSVSPFCLTVYFRWRRY